MFSSLFVDSDIPKVSVDVVRVDDIPFLYSVTLIFPDGDEVTAHTVSAFVADAAEKAEQFAEAYRMGLTQGCYYAKAWIQSVEDKSK